MKEKLWKIMTKFGKLISDNEKRQNGFSKSLKLYKLQKLA